MGPGLWVRVGAARGMGGHVVVLVGLLGRSGVGACPNLPQRPPGPGSAAKKIPEYQRFFSRASARSGPLWQIWTTRAAADLREGRHEPASGRGERPQRRDVHFAFESAVPTVILESKMHLSTRKGPVAAVADRGADRPGTSPVTW